jgi:BlaI family penicillinase repressor
MRVLWDRGRATAREITDEVSRERDIAHSTVQTLLRKLEAKGAVGHDVEGRTFVFHPLVTETEVRRSATRELLSRVFQGSPVGLVAHLVRQEDISDEELEAMRRLIDEAKEDG